MYIQYVMNMLVVMIFPGASIDRGEFIIADQISASDAHAKRGSGCLNKSKI